LKQSSGLLLVIQLATLIQFRQPWCSNIFLCHF